MPFGAAQGDNLGSQASLKYLETYPFPAFILSHQQDQSGPSRRRISWSNRRWVEWSDGRSLGDLISDRAAKSFEEWTNTPFQDTLFPLKHGSNTLNLIRTEIIREGSLPAIVITSVPLDYRVKTIPVANTDSLPTVLNEIHSNPLVSPELLEEPTHFSLTTQRPSDNNTSALSSLACKSLLESTDWSKTKLGPREKWSRVIETMLEVILRSPTQDALWLGEDFQMLYNDNYAQIVNHPLMWGRSAKVKEAWGPVWEGVSHLINNCLTLGEPCYREDDLLLYRKNSKGYWVEKYHTWSFIPLFDEDGKPLGLFNPTRDTTASVLARRRQESMRDLSERLLTARNTTEYYSGIADVMEDNPKDVPFLMCYSIEDGAEPGLVKLHLESSIGVPPDHQAAPCNLTLSLSADRLSRSSYGPKANQISSPALSAISALSSGNGGRVQYSYDKTAWPIARAISTRQVIVVDDCTELIKGFPLRQWETLPDSAIIVPISSEASTDLPQSVIILGLNVASPLDSVYEDWVHVLRAHLTSSLGSVRAAEEEQQRQTERDRMERAKTAWFQGAAHDLRSPLTLVAGPLDDVLRTTLSSDQRSALSLAQRNLARVQRLVNALLDFSRIEAGKLTGRFLPVDLGTFVGDLATIFRPAVERRRIKYDINIEPHDGMVFVDPTLFETVVTNLISNALKYTEGGAISVNLIYHAAYADISIIDTGVGIPHDELSAVTDRFHRATTALSRGTEGTGIGLALSKEIVKLHGGDLLITSKTAEETGGPHGSTFTARIPLVERQVNADQLEPAEFGVYGKAVFDEAMHWRAPSDAETESAVSEADQSVSSRADGFLFDRNDVLLLVDDNTDMRHYVKSIFAPYCKVVEAVNGKDALQKAIKNPPNLILSDLMMPVMNGQQLLMAIRSNPSTRMVPMVLLSAATDDEIRLAAFVEGAEDFMLKPFKPKELLARVHLHMQIGKNRAHLEMLYAQRQQELAVVLDYCPSGIIRADAEGNIVYGNDTYRMYTGIPLDVDLNNWADYVDDDVRPQLEEAWHGVIVGEERATTRTWKWSNGTVVSGTFIRLDKIDPSLSGVIGCLSDISYQEERIVEAERRRLEAEESKHQQELLVDLTSHEIRTPVSAILQCSSLVRENLTALQAQLREVGTNGFTATPQLLAEIDEDLEALDSIHQCGLVQERIANDVLSLARIQLDMLSLHDYESDLRTEARKMKKIRLVLEFGENIQRTGIASIKTDHVRLHQVVTNLITNAIRFTATSTTRIITVKYEIGLVPPSDDTCEPSTQQTEVSLPLKEDTPVWLFIAIKDTGPGLGPAEQANLFQRFSQGNKMIHTKYGGSGLGLFICKRISELLGGRIELESQLGVGIFRFFIEARTGRPQTSITDTIKSLTLTSPKKPTLSLSPGPTPANSSNLNFLIVEDNIINQTVLKRQIIKAGFTCDVANNGQEALDYLHEIHSSAKQTTKRSYDVVLMDLEMPVMDGLTAVKYIRRAEAEGIYQRQLVIALTGNARQGQIDQALAEGMDDVVIKPYRLPDLIAKVKNKIGAMP
ncbi:uncharacterized protein I303_106901 [Kwoniella dejecticola CBS 10117]|uniref:Two-component system sensor protein n=1 Tax=Kwoniella dejecticola CBS 10117 TaxID=1296121 RepID=A0AAJ8MI49_9TREE